MLRLYLKFFFISVMRLRVLNIDFMLNKWKNNRWPEANITLFSILSFFHGGHLENHPTWRVGHKISSVNILILNQWGPINNIILLPEGP